MNRLLCGITEVEEEEEEVFEWIGNTINILTEAADDVTSFQRGIRIECARDSRIGGRPAELSRIGGRPRGVRIVVSSSCDFGIYFLLNDYRIKVIIIMVIVRK